MWNATNASNRMIREHVISTFKKNSIANNWIGLRAKIHIVFEVFIFRKFQFDLFVLLLGALRGYGPMVPPRGHPARFICRDRTWGDTSTMRVYGSACSVSNSTTQTTPERLVRSCAYSSASGFAAKKRIPGMRNSCKYSWKLAKSLKWFANKIWNIWNMLII